MCLQNCWMNPPPQPPALKIIRKQRVIQGALRILSAGFLLRRRVVDFLPGLLRRRAPEKFSRHPACPAGHMPVSEGNEPGLNKRVPAGTAIAVYYSPILLNGLFVTVSSWVLLPCPRIEKTVTCINSCKLTIIIISTKKIIIYNKM